MNNQEMQALLRGQSMLAEMLKKLVEITIKPRKRTAIRDPKTRELLHVLESNESNEQSDQGMPL
jgi:hypothetical protein